jgi:hypothetical protein
MSDKRLELFERVLQACERDYRDKLEVFYRLDDKAQSNATIAGILIAACVAFVQEETVQRIAHVYGKLGPTLLAATIVLSVLSIVFCLGSMKILEVETPPDSEEVSRWVNNLAELDDSEFTSRRLENFIRDEAKVWKRAILDHSRVNKKKANWLLAAQSVLFLAFVCITIVAIIFLFSFR